MPRPTISVDELQDIIREDLEQFEKTISEIKSKADIILDRQKEPFLKEGGLSPSAFYKKAGL